MKLFGIYVTELAGQPLMIPIRIVAWTTEPRHQRLLVRIPPANEEGPTHAA